MSELPRTKDFQRATEIAGAIKRRLPIRRSSAAAAKQSHVTIAEDANVTATVGIAPREDHDGLTLQLALAVDLPGLERTTAERIVAAAHKACPYSDALRRNVDVHLTIA